jgi:ATP-dependent Lon protease
MVNNLRKRKRSHGYDIDDFIVDDKIENRNDKKRIKKDDDPIDPNKKKRYEKIKELKELILNKESNIDKIFDLDLSGDDAIWFIEHIDILKHAQSYSEERYKIKSIIYQKIKELEKNYHQKETIDKLKKLSNIKEDLLTEILESKHNDYIKSILYKKYTAIKEIEKTDEYFKIFEWIQTALELPTEVKSVIDHDENISTKLINMKETLNSKLYGLYHIKDKILESYCAMLTNPHYKKKFMALEGPPGVGKTSIAMAVAEAMGLPFAHISFAGMKDAAILKGHSPTYVGSKPGIFVDILRKAQVLNAVILLDEIDKIPDTEEGQAVSTALLSILDTTQNDKFQDMYMSEIPINLSYCFYMLSLNDVSRLSPILKNRLYIIPISGYSVDEKVKIGIRYLLPRTLESLSFKKDDIMICDNVMKYLVQKIELMFKKEYGVRELEKGIITICERFNVLKHTKGQNIKFTYELTDINFPLNLTEKQVDILIS